jgi:hypothetical protein
MNYNCNKCHNKKVTASTTDAVYGDDDHIITGCDYKCFEDMSMNTDEDCDMYDPEEDETDDIWGAIPLGNFLTDEEIEQIERMNDYEQFSEL